VSALVQSLTGFGRAPPAKGSCCCCNIKCWYPTVICVGNKAHVHDVVSKSSPIDGSDVDLMLTMGGVEHRAATHPEKVRHRCSTSAEVSLDLHVVVSGGCWRSPETHAFCVSHASRAQEHVQSSVWSASATPHCIEVSHGGTIR